ncbi:MAG: nitrite/sulfite reductase [Vicingaceae bacterium]
MKSFRTELENPITNIVEQDIIELGKKIYAYKNGELPEDTFKALRLARGIYGQRQLGVQMIRIKIPYGKISTDQLIKLADISDEYANGNLHFTTRQDVQLHFVSLDNTPELWEKLEEEKLTIREACGNTVRNITACEYAGIDKNEPFDVRPYADALYKFLLRNPVNQDLGRKFKIAFASSDEKDALTAFNDLGLIPKIKLNKRKALKGFKVILGGGLGAQPFSGKVVYNFLPADQLAAFTIAVLRVFDRYGERSKRNKARLKYLLQKIGIDQFIQLVNDELFVIKEHLTVNESLFQETFEPKIINQNVDVLNSTAYNAWKSTNVFEQKQKGLFGIKIKLPQGNLSSDKARKLAAIVAKFSFGELTSTINQGLIIRHVHPSALPHFYVHLNELGLALPGFDSVADVTACPGTDTCNLGITNSTTLAQQIEQFVYQNYPELVYNNDIKIKISGCFNACGQHSIASIGFHGSSINTPDGLLPAVQVLLGGYINKEGHSKTAEKVIKVPTKRALNVIELVLNDYLRNNVNQPFHKYYESKGNHYFYELLKQLADTANLKAADYIDWGNEKKFVRSIGVGECAGVVVDLKKAILLEINEKIERAKQTLANNKFNDSVYFIYSAFIQLGKYLLIEKGKQYNSQINILETVDMLDVFNFSYKELVLKINKKEATEKFAQTYLKEFFDIIKTLKIDLK